MTQGERRSRAQGGSVKVKVSEHHIDIVSVNALLCNAVEAEVSQACDLTVSQYRALLRLVVNRKPMRMTELAKQLFLSQSAVTAAVTRLEERGAIKRVDSAADRRTVLVELTAKGAETIVAADKAVTGHIVAIKELLDERVAAAMLQRCAEVVDHYDIARVENDRIRADSAFFDTLLIVQSHIAIATKAHGLSVGEYRVLYLLSLMHDGARPSALSSELVMRTNDVTVATNKLIESDLVKRSRDPRDRRAFILEITSKGYEVANKTAFAVATRVRHLYPTEIEILDVHDSLSHTLMNRFRQQRGI